MLSRLQRDGRGAFAFVCAMAMALAFAMPTSAAPQCDIKGTDKSETIVGTDKSEVICGFGGNDVIYGKGGNDVIRGGSGNDRLHGGPGNDKLIGGTGDDRLNGNRGDDALGGGSGNDRLHGGAGDDSLVGGKGTDRLFGLTGDDTMVGGPGNDTLVGGAGVDDVRGGTGDDRLEGGPGNDTLDGEAGQDKVLGGAGDDSVRGAAGADELYGDEGNDRLYGDDGDDRLYGGSGRDYLDGGRHGDHLYGGPDNDELHGGTGDDVIRGSTGNDELQGGSGDDTLYGDAGNDTLRGSAGKDVLNGGPQADLLYGGTGADRLVGGDGKDKLYGLAGNDRLISRDGMKDVVRGGSGRDGCNEDRKDDLEGVEYVIGQGSSWRSDGSDGLRGGGSTTIVRPTEPAPGGIVSAIHRAPLAADGNVAGAGTDIVIDLDRSLDPAVEGRTLEVGRAIRVILPDDFGTSDLPTSGPVTCDTAAGACNTGILVGAPSEVPGEPGQAAYAVELEGERTIVFTALRDLGLGDMPGIKQIHLALPGFTNPQAGKYTVVVESETGPGGAIETGSAELTVYPSIRPGISATNLFAASEGQPLPDVAFQSTSTDTATPLAWDLLMWERGGVPAVGVELSQRDRRGGDILQHGSSIGSFTIEAPAGALGQTVSGEPSVLSDIPGTTDKAGRLTATFTAGDMPGLYEVTFVLDEGNSQKMQVEVE